MSLESLLTVLTPPANPAEPPTPEGWNDVEARLEELPHDYKAFIQHFGSGTIDNFLWCWCWSWIRPLIIRTCWMLSGRAWRACCQRECTWMSGQKSRATICYPRFGALGRTCIARRHLRKSRGGKSSDQSIAYMKLLYILFLSALATVMLSGCATSQNSQQSASPTISGYISVGGEKNFK